jgi:hypothetical protein
MFLRGGFSYPITDDTTSIVQYIVRNIFTLPCEAFLNTGFTMPRLGFPVPFW